MTVDPRSIDAYGLKQFLDGSRWKHNDNGYDDFLKLLDENKKDPRRFPMDEVARHMNVSRRTATDWKIRIEEKEKNRANK